MSKSINLEENLSYTQSANVPPLSGVLNCSSRELLPDTENYRRYVGSVTSSLPIRGVADSDVKSILYEVGVKDPSSKTALAVSIEPKDRVGQTIRTNSVISTELVGFHKKYSNFTGSFDHMDLSAIGNQLARALAMFTATGRLTCDDIRAGSPCAVRALGIREDPISSSSNSVFVPRHTALDSCPGAFYAITAAANAYGSHVFTDVVAVDGNNAPIMVEPTDGDLALGCLYGIRILVSMYAAANEGSTMAFAIVKGVHESLKVVGHTDEGGYMRRVLRRKGFVAPYGGIYSSFQSSYMGIPVASSWMPKTFQTIIDTIALKSAALTALCDPLILMNNQYFPSVFTTTLSVPLRDGNKHLFSRDLNRQIASHCSSFVSEYVKKLGWLFGLTGDQGSKSEAFMQAQFNSMVVCEDRHTSRESVAPYYWIEPTSLFDEAPETLAGKHGYGVIARVGGSSEYPMFDGGDVKCDIRGTVGLVTHNWRTARTCPLVLHLQGHPLDGLASLIPTQFAASGIASMGGVEDAATLRAARGDIAQYLWGRGQSPFPAPAELIYTSVKMGTVISQSSFDVDRMRHDFCHVPTFSELRNGNVTFSASMPSSAGRAKISVFTRKIQAKRTNAAVALTNARAASFSDAGWALSDWGVGDYVPESVGVAIEMPQSKVAENVGVIAAKPISITTAGAPNKPVVFDSQSSYKGKGSVGVSHSTKKTAAAGPSSMATNSPEAPRYTGAKDPADAKAVALEKFVASNQAEINASARGALYSRRFMDGMLELGYPDSNSFETACDALLRSEGALEDSRAYHGEADAAGNSAEPSADGS